MVVVALLDLCSSISCVYNKGSSIMRFSVLVFRLFVSNAPVALKLQLIVLLSNYSSTSPPFYSTRKSVIPNQEFLPRPPTLQATSSELYRSPLPQWQSPTKSFSTPQAKASRHQPKPTTAPLRTVTNLHPTIMPTQLARSHLRAPHPTSPRKATKSTP